ncbi:DnaJ domain-containing protein [Pseudomonas sp. M30-35]|uniref:DnaJ domain-containing protein n=1 Tax=Pseudomonas sp. M30-35 TaxID=1981174 RepID=UPI000B3C2487|nr:DnaJ domain-containing protein [Pseudomonas sp. M30-35]ARU87010.1 molecular chaperone DjlA [Pseudomonas sp. M30-35]
MIWPSTVLGAVAGFAIASIPGGLLGALLGQVVDRRLRMASWAQLRERLGGPAQTDDDQLLFLMLGRLAKCDGRVLPQHIEQVRLEMQRLRLDEVAQRRAIEAFSRGKTGRDNLRTPLRSQSRNATPLLSACWRVANAAGRVSRTERELILLWGTWLGVSVHANESLRTGGQSMPVSSAYQQALRLLGVTAQSERAEIKRAYRLLLSRHHPDKLQGSGASVDQVRAATDKTRELHQAYEVVRKRHGF